MRTRGLAFPVWLPPRCVIVWDEGKLPRVISEGIKRAWKSTRKRKPGQMALL
mgnify:FL=1